MLLESVRRVLQTGIIRFKTARHTWIPSLIRQNINNGEYTEKVRENYNLIVPENELKPQCIWLGENS
jgi:hypothetical protein